MCEGGRFVGRGEIPALNAIGAEIQGLVALIHGFKAEGGVVLAGAKIGRNLVCDSGQFGSKDEALALNANSATIQGHAFLRNTITVEGGVDFSASTIGGDLACDGGHFVSKGNAPALLANGARIQGSVYLRKKFNATGGADFTIATIGGHVECDDGVFVSRGQIPALDLGGATIHGAVSLRRNFTAEGGVDLKFAKIGGNLDCYFGKFIAMGVFMALNANGAKIGGNAGLRGDLWGNFDAVGQVDFTGATIGGNLKCSNGHFKAQGQKAALLVNSATVLGSVHLRTGFKAVGEVDFTNAKIAGNFDCDSGQFIGQSGALAVIGDGAKIAGSAYFRGTEIQGEVRFGFAHIERNFQWFRIKSREKVTLDLRFTNVRVLLNDDQDSWPEEGKLILDGFVYEKLDTEAPSNAEMQLGWLRLQPRNRFLSQPFEQLATVFRNMGLEEDARKVMIEKNKDYASYLHWRWAWLWYGLFGKLIGYGYRPRRAFCISLFFIGFGYLLFNAGFNSKVITPPEERAFVGQTGGIRQLSKLYPRFDALAYSVETFVPFLKLGVSQYWMPNATCHGALQLGNLVIPIAGRVLRYYLWLHIAAGWVLSALWVGAITGLLKT